MRLVVVGAALAGLRAAEAARQVDETCSITLVGAEVHVPYDRPPLSKELLKVDALRAESEFRDETALRDELRIDLRLGAPASTLDTELHTIGVGDELIPYDKLIIATGSSARRLPGTDGLTGVHVLRTIDDSRAIRAALEQGARTVIVGAGFIGSEIASAARARGLSATVVEALATPLVRAIGPRLGAACGALHTANGTTVLCDAKVEAIEGDERVERVRLANGTVLDADLVVVGVGAIPNTGWLDGSGLAIENGIVCDEYLRTSDPDVYAAGDVARWRNPLFDRVMRIEHWTNAAEQGTRAGRNALDPEHAEPYSTVPYFWSDWYGSRIQFVGVPNDDEVEVVAGELGTDQFVALYREGERITGVLALNAQRHVMRYRKLISEGASFTDALELSRTLPPLPSRKP
ncbi:MAG: FAD-dependent oxidoreductase [Actinomycetota bacterium]|nr:FAD-dependent oxidoreductase [Actinomycetota bacterium]